MWVFTVFLKDTTTEFDSKRHCNVLKLQSMVPGHPWPKPAFVNEQFYCTERNWTVIYRFLLVLCALNQPIMLK